MSGRSFPAGQISARAATVTAIAVVTSALALAMGQGGCGSSPASAAKVDAGPNPACAMTRPPECAPGCTACGNDTCVDLTADPQHCGSCATTCNATLSCVSSTCECAPRESLCAAVCVELEADPTNCGTCGTACTGGACNGGHCVFPTVLAANLEKPTGLAVDSTNVYFATTTINRVPIGSGPVTTLGGTRANTMAIDGNNVYWSDVGVGIQKIPLGGGAATILAPQGQGVQIAVDATNVYWTDNFPDAVEGYKVNQVPIAGGTVAELADDDGFGLGGLAVSGSVIYFATPTALFRTSPSGGSRTQVAPFESSTDVSTQVSLLALKGDAVYVSLNTQPVGIPNEAGNYCITRVPVSGATMPSACLAYGIGTVVDVKADDSFVYFTNTWSVMKVPTAGGKVVTLAGGQSATNLAIDGSYLYWSNAGTSGAGTTGMPDGAIVKIAK